MTFDDAPVVYGGMTFPSNEVTIVEWPRERVMLVDRHRPPCDMLLGGVVIGTLYRSLCGELKLRFRGPDGDVCVGMAIMQSPLLGAFMAQAAALQIRDSPYCECDEKRCREIY